MSGKMFELKKGRGPPAARVVAPKADEPAEYQRKWTEEEAKTAIIGYIKVDPRFYDAIRYASHVRYFSKRDGFRPGGFVARNPHDVKDIGSNAEKRYMKLQNSFFPKAAGYVSWLVAYDDIDQLYLKPDAETLIVLDTVTKGITGLNANIRKIAEQIAGLNARVSALE